MRKKTKLLFLTTFVFLAVTVFLTFTATVWDIAPIGPCDTEVAYASVNGFFAEKLPYNDMFYRISEYLGYIAIASCGCFGILGLYQLIRRGSLRKVDAELYLLLGLYVLFAVVYIVFDKVIVLNYRPVLTAGETFPEPSFPSSHTMLVTVFLGSAALLVRKYIKNRPLASLYRTVCLTLIPLTVLARFLSGVHWFTDIIGGFLYAAVLLLLFLSARSAAADYRRNNRF